MIPRARLPEELKREMEIVNDPINRRIEAALNGERVRPVSASSSLGLEQEEHKVIEDDRAIAAVIASELIEQDDSDLVSSTSSPALTTQTKQTFSIPTWWVMFHNIPGIDRMDSDTQYLCLVYADYIFAWSTLTIFIYPKRK